MKKHPLTQIQTETIGIAPSILAADFSILGAEIKHAENAGADLLHVDIMDGHFVPNLSMGPPIVKAVRKASMLPFDVHLMVTNPENYALPFIEAGADHITIHVEIDSDIAEILRQIHRTGCSAGLSLRPGTPAASLLPYMEEIDLILVMTVEPGFGGQAFRTDVLPKIQEIRTMIDQAHRPIHLEVDGGINTTTAPRVLAAGANLLVAGTSVFRAKEGMPAAIKALRMT